VPFQIDLVPATSPIISISTQAYQPRRPVALPFIVLAEAGTAVRVVPAESERSTDPYLPANPD
jgi:hypothetical protein